MNILNKKSVGIDIADRTIEVVELTKKRGKVIISSRGREKIDAGIVERGIIKDKEKLSLAIKEAFAKAKPSPITNKNIIFGLPESQVYFHIFSIDISNKENIDKLVLAEAKKNIPLEFNDLVFHYQELSRDKEKKEFLITATSFIVAREWQDFFYKLDINIDFFDIETLATFRSIFFDGTEKQVCLVDIGSMTTSISIFNKHGFIYSYSVKNAGNAITDEIANVLKLKIDEAEEQKIKFGLSKKNSPLYKAIIKKLEEIKKEIVNTIDYIQDKTNEEIIEIVLIGGTCQMNGIVSYFKENLKKPVSLGKLSVTKEGASLVYLTAAGYAMRGLNKKWQDDPDLRLGSKKDTKIQSKSKPIANTIKISEEPISENGNSNNKLDFQKKLLIIIVVIGIILISGSFWYRGYSKNQKTNEINKILEDQKQIEYIGGDVTKKETGEQSTTTPKVIEVEQEKVIIKNTETNFLNVREGPSIANSIITKIYPGEIYVLLGEENSWANIELETGEEGWISKKYTEIIE